MNKPIPPVTVKGIGVFYAKIHSTMTRDDLFQQYLKWLADEALKGDAREESFYPALKELLQAFARTQGYAHVHVTVQPRPTEAGNPDFRVWDGQQHIIGYIEAKPPTADL